VFLRFDVNEVPEGAVAQLRLHQDGLGVGGLRYAIATVTEPWDEQTITFANRPASELPWRHWFPRQVGRSAIDVTEQVEAAINAGTPLSVKIWASADYGGAGYTRFGAHEGAEARRPQLVYAVADPEMPTTSTTDDGTETDEPTTATATNTTSGEESSGDPTTAGPTTSTGATTNNPETSPTGGSGMSEGTGSMEDDATGCACRADSQAPWSWLFLLGFLPLVTRRRAP